MLSLIWVNTVAALWTEKLINGRPRQMICQAGIQSRATIGPPAKRRSDGFLLVGRYWPDFTCLLGIHRLITKTRTVQGILDEQPRLMRACVSEHLLLAYSKQV